jgi:hypothetical protein
VGRAKARRAVIVAVENPAKKLLNVVQKNVIDF